MPIQIKNLNKSFGNIQVLHDINLEIPDGNLVALLGPSGSGKTTLLRMIAGLDSPDTGEIIFPENAKTEKDKKVGFVFQHYALFRHMSIFDNIAFGLNVRPRSERPTKSEIKEKVLQLLKLIQLENFHDRYPFELSGGQRQRVALARALAIEPKFLLLDEPFGALDAKVRKELRNWLRRLHDEIHITSVFVTHDQDEALEVSDRIVILHNGRIEQIGTPDEVYNSPKSPFVFNFLGDVNLFHGRIQDGDNRSDTENSEDGADPKSVAYVRPYDVEIVRSQESGIPAEIRHIHSTGRNVRVELKRQDTGFLVESVIDRDTYKELNLLPGEIVYLRIRKAQVYTEDFSI
ncbi:sulfate/molybdate ABC transporter ATP-binding protein [Leptospira sp. GIMC2001]|uniref:sulfate/molybdate ABC transporter ATP-binding protein n=1 Tax=Leptospira sp. GIMC2001 TaxID=1513297 RepID=UPI00234A0DBA|nr:sulfate/molybdate ABC transporter ATP-binding protein [Leptospira sp. GIMC2001]WCL49242.1 sulfate/molybdate ABC transporter ATP-binding protein [Leptospira sp. GIMC2001]